MSETSSGQHEDRRRSPPLDKRLERFAQRYADSPIKLDTVRTVGHYPSRFHAPACLQYSPVAPLPDIERTVLELGDWALVQATRRGDVLRVSLSRSPVVWESPVLLPRYSAKPGGRETPVRVTGTRCPDSR
jgi:hypothetical protein